MHAVLILALVAAAPAEAPKRADTPVPVFIRAAGIGRPPPGKSGRQAWLMARRAAEVVAVRNLAAKLEVSSPKRQDGHYGHYAVTAPRLVRGFRYLPPRTLPDGRVAVTVEMPLYEQRRTVHIVGLRAGHLKTYVTTTCIHTQRSHSPPPR